MSAPPSPNVPGRQHPEAADWADTPTLPPPSGSLLPAQAMAFSTRVSPPCASAAETRVPADLGEAAGPPRPSLERIGGYEILRELGRGGMGVVHQARQVALNRLVALKMIRAGFQAATEDRTRFRLEAEAIARLQHANIVQIYEIGEHDGQPFLSLEYIAGGSLTAALDGTPWPGRQAAQLVETLAHAMHYAHQHGIVHRDLKPANILLLHSSTKDMQGHQEKGALAGSPGDASCPSWIQATPKITDFGLAKRLDVASGPTQSGAIMGTPSYMAPEQAAGQTKQIGPATDVYALGAILYELITGRSPFRAETPLDTLRQVLERDPAPPELLNAAVDRDLQTICLKCLEKEPAHRYATAEDLAEDLRRYQHGEAIRARGFSVLDRLVRTLGRSRHDVEFQNDGTMLYYFAGIVLITELLLFLLIQAGQAKLWCALTRIAVQFLPMGVVLWRYRSSRLWPTSASEQQMWSIWIGYIVTCSLIGQAQTIQSGLMASFDLAIYPNWAAVTGLTFFMMGSSYWGRCYAIGLAFFACSLVMFLKLDWAPLEFGFLWSATLVSIGRHLRRLGMDANVAAHQLSLKRPEEDHPRLF